MCNSEPNLKPVSNKTPRWLVALVVLQSLTLLAVLCGNPQVLPSAAASQGAAAQQDRENVLPNAAHQRQEQIRLLQQIAGELTKANASLDKISRNGEQQPAQ